MTLSKINEKMKFVIYAAAVIGIVKTIINTSLNKGIIIYQDKMVSISFLVPCHNYFWGGFIIAFVGFLAYYGWKIYSFIKGLERDNDLWDAYLLLYTLMPLFLWLGIFKILSEPTPILPLILSLIIFVPPALFLTRLSYYFIKGILSDWAT